MKSSKEKNEIDRDNSGPVGKSERRVDAVDKVTRKAVYADDYRPQGLLHAEVVRSNVSSGEIMSLDTSEAEGLEGVKAVITYEDVPGDNAVPVIEDDQPALASDQVRYVGEPVALVAGESKEAAERGAEAVEVEYSEKEAVFDPIEALENGSPQVAQDDVNEEGNLYEKWSWKRGI